MLTTHEKSVLRTLVSEYMTFASLPVQKEKIELWKALNRGEMIRPMVTIDQLPWPELMCGELVCEIADPIWRAVEDDLRKTLYKWKHFPADMVLDPFIAVPKAVRRSGFGMKVMQETLGPEDSTAKAQRYINQIVELDDVWKILDERITHDEDETARRMAEAEALFGDLAPVRAAGCDFHLGIWDRLTSYMSVDECYLAFYDNPELLHAAMERLTCATIAAIDDANRLGVCNDIANVCHCSHIYTDELLPDSGAGKGSVTKNCWSLGLAQLFTAVSPELFGEFELPYITRMAEYFGMIYYGCCDRLDDRLDLVKRIPNVRKVSCSPWSDRAAFAEKIGAKLVMSAKPTPALLATGSFDEDAVRRDLELTRELAGRYHVNLEFLLKDVSTVRNEPERLTRWADTAVRVMEK